MEKKDPQNVLEGGFYSLLEGAKNDRKGVNTTTNNKRQLG